MSLDRGRLVEFLEVVDTELNEKITLVAAGGTAMTLLGLKPSTIDMDFTGPSRDVRMFKAAAEEIPHGFKIDCWEDGMVFSQILPDDYLEKSIPVKTGLKHIELRALHPLDIVVTKIGRLDRRDAQDIETCIKNRALTQTQIRRRAAVVQYVGKEENYQINLQHVLTQFFGKRQPKVQGTLVHVQLRPPVRRKHDRTKTKRVHARES